MDFTADVQFKSEPDFVEYPANNGREPPPPGVPVSEQEVTYPLTSPAPGIHQNAPIPVPPPSVNPQSGAPSASAPIEQDGQLKPEEPPAKVYSCEVCSIAAMSEQNYDFHMKGQRHQKNMRHRQMGLPIVGPQYGGAGRKKPKKADIDSLFVQIKEPVIGLKYIIEHQKEGQSVEPSYECTLCNSTMDPRVITPHIVGYKHRLAYMEKHFPVFHSTVVNEKQKRSEASAQIEEFARKIEDEEGRGEVKVKTELNPFFRPSRQKDGEDSGMQPVVGSNPNVLICKACNIIVNGPSVWEQHIRGTRHQKNIGVDPATVGKESIITVNKRAVIQDDVDKYSGKALIGIEYIEEFQKAHSNLEPRYVCTLCEGKCDPRTLFSHITGSKHRINYIKKHLPETGKSLFTGDAQNMKKSEIGPILEGVAAEVESKEGRKTVVVKIDKNDYIPPPNYGGMKRKSDSAMGGPPMKYGRGGRGRGGFSETRSIGRGRGSDMHSRGGLRGRGGMLPSRGAGRGMGRGMRQDGGFDGYRGRGHGMGESRGRGRGMPRGRAQVVVRARGRGFGPQPPSWSQPVDYTEDNWQNYDDQQDFASDTGFEPTFDMPRRPPGFTGRGRGRGSMLKPKPERNFFNNQYDEQAPSGFNAYDEQQGYMDEAQPDYSADPFGGTPGMHAPNLYGQERDQSRPMRGMPRNSNYYDFTSDQADVPPLPREPPPRPPPAPPMPGEASTGAANSSLAGMLKQMTQCLVNNEDEADVALQVSNALTQALLTYRMKNQDGTPNPN